MVIHPTRPFASRFTSARVALHVRSHHASRLLVSRFTSVLVALHVRSHRPLLLHASPFTSVRIIPARPFSPLLRDARTRSQARCVNLICAKRAFGFAQAACLIGRRGGAQAARRLSGTYCLVGGLPSGGQSHISFSQMREQMGLSL